MTKYSVEYEAIALNQMLAVFYIQHEELNSDPYHPYEELVVLSCTYNILDGDRKIPGACLSASLAEIVNSAFSVKPCLKKIRCRAKEEQISLNLLYNTYLFIQACNPHAGEHTHTYTHSSNAEPFMVRVLQQS